MEHKKDKNGKSIQITLDFRLSYRMSIVVITPYSTMKLQSSPIITRRGAKNAKIQTRGMAREQEARKPSSSLVEIKKKGREKLNSSPGERVLIKDIYESVSVFCRKLLCLILVFVLFI